MIKPLYYQEEGFIETLEKFKTYDKIAYWGTTGSGKTFTSGFIIREFVNKGKVLVAVHKEELLYQFEETLIKLGLTCEIITSKKKRLSHHADVYIGMQKTLTNRIRDNKYFLKPLSLIVVDEAHYLGYLDIFNAYPNVKKLGLSATWCILGNDTFFKCNCCSTEYKELTQCCGQEVEEWSRPKTMSKYFDEIVRGPKPSVLIEFGQIVREYNVIINNDLSKLSTDSGGEFTNKSIKETFGNEKVIFDVVTNYEAYALNQKTLIFNANTEVNELVYQQFKEKRYNVKRYDSINTAGVSKMDTLNWFRNTPDAVLMGVGSFIAGTDVRDIQCVIANFATNSLSKYIQSTARGGRSCDWIFKDKFTYIDLGGNVDRHLTLSDDSRDWRKIFFNGLGKTAAKKEPIENVRECVSCGALTSRTNAECEICGYIEPKKEVEKKVIVSDEIAKPISTPQPPNAQKIIEFCERKNGDMNLAFKIFTEQVIMLFRFHQVTRELYHSTKINGKFDKKIDKMCRTFYFALLNSTLESNVNRKLDTFTEKTKKKIASLYE